LIEFIGAAISAGVDLIQLRERDLSARQLLTILESVNLPSTGGQKILVNDRADVAKCAGAGVHLTTRSLKPDAVRRAFGTEMLIGASTHNRREAEEAAELGADFIVFGPVFETESKREYGCPIGVSALKETASSAQIPVLALGGIKPDNFRQALDSGASGIAAISMFVDAGDLASLVRQIKSNPI
jgi:thiamine-phosphate pyrophosphorylase